MENNKISDMLTFYREYRDSFVRMIEIEVHQSEQRIRFFLAFVTGILALIGILNNESLKYFDFFWVASVSLAILITYGLLTFSQIIRSRFEIHNLDVTRGVLDELIKEYEPVLKSKIENADLRDEAEIKFIKDFKGTFAQYMYLTEGLLIGGFVFLIGGKIFPNQYFLIIGFALLFSIITIIVMIKWATIIKKGKPKINIKNSAD